MEFYGPPLNHLAHVLQPKQVAVIDTHRHTHTQRWYVLQRCQKTFTHRSLILIENVIVSKLNKMLNFSACEKSTLPLSRYPYNYLSNVDGDICSPTKEDLPIINEMRSVGSHTPNQSGDWQVPVRAPAAQQLLFVDCELFLATHHVPRLCGRSQPRGGDDVWIHRVLRLDSWEATRCRYVTLVPRSHGDARLGKLERGAVLFGTMQTTEDFGSWKPGLFLKSFLKIPLRNKEKKIRFGQ